MIGHHGLVALLELDLGRLVRLHPELGDHLGQGHLHLGHGEPLPCGRNMKLDQGALGMSDPCGPLQLALKPNSVPRINYLLPTFTFVLIDVLSLVKW